MLKSWDLERRDKTIKKKKERKKERAHINKISLKVRELQPIPKNKNNHKIIL